MRAGSTLPGLLLTPAAPAKVESWVRRGLVPAYVVPLGVWVGVVPGGDSLAGPPYDDGLTVLAARPVPAGLRPAVGFYVVERGRTAVVAVHPQGARGASRWLSWVPGRGAMEVPGHDPASVRDLLAVAGLMDAERRPVLEVLARTDGACGAVLGDLVARLGLPGAELLAAAPTQPDATLVTPSARTIERFEKDVSEEAQVRRELEGR